MGMDEKKPKLNLHLVFLGIALLVILAAVIRVLVWNMGSESDYDPNAPQTTAFDTEPLDVMFKLTPDKLEAHPEDGVERILFLGNNVITDGHDPDEEGNIAELLSADYEAEVLNPGFQGSMIACDSSEYIDTCPWDAFRLYHLCDALCRGDFSLQKKAIEEMEFVELNRDRYEESLNLLSTLDVNTLDVLVIFYDAADMLNYRPVSEKTGHDISTVCGALASSVELVQKTFPFLRIVIMSPYHAYAVSSEGYYESLDTLDYGNGSLPYYLYSIADVAQMYDISLVDNYYGTINELSGTEYLENNIKLNNAGRRKMEERLAGFLELAKRSVKN